MGDKTYEILRVLCGSRAYGLEDDDSDFDYHGVFVVPTARLLAVGMPKVKETRWVEDSREDDVSWEVGHFLSLALRCNPTILETFVAPIENEGDCEDGLCDGDCGKGDWGCRLRSLLPQVVSRKQVYESFRGYAKNQRNKMFDPAGGVRALDRRGKFAMTYLRVLSQGAQLLRDGPAYWTVRVHDGPENEFLREVKLGEVKTGHIIDEAEFREKALTDAYLASTMREEPDLQCVNEWLLSLRSAFL